MITAFNQTDVTFSNIFSMSNLMSKSATASTQISTSIAILNSYDGGNATNTATIINTNTISWIGVQGAIDGINSIAGSTGIIQNLITSFQAITNQFNTWILDFNMVTIITNISTFTASANASLLTHIGTSSNVPMFVDPTTKG